MITLKEGIWHRKIGFVFGGWLGMDGWKVKTRLKGLHSVAQAAMYCEFNCFSLLPEFEIFLWPYRILKWFNWFVLICKCTNESKAQKENHFEWNWIFGIMKCCCIVVLYLLILHCSCGGYNYLPTKQRGK